ncbi:dpp target gene isoform 2-T2 [Cochliomyia hominivorax]
MANSCREMFYVKCERNRMCNRFTTYETHFKKKTTLVILLLLIIQTKSKNVVECSEIMFNGLRFAQSTKVYSPKNIKLSEKTQNMDYFDNENQNDNLELSVRSETEEIGKSPLLENNDLRETYSVDIFPTDSDGESNMEDVYTKKDIYQSSPSIINNLFKFSNNNQNQNNHSKIERLISILPSLEDKINDTKLAAQNNSVLDMEKPHGSIMENTAMKSVLENQGINEKEDNNLLNTTTIQSNQKTNVSEINVDKHDLGDLKKIIQSLQVKTKENYNCFEDETLESLSTENSQVMEDDNSIYNDNLAKHTVIKNELDNQEFSNVEYITTTHSLLPKKIENGDLLTTTEKSDQTNSLSENDKYDSDEKLKINIDRKQKNYFEKNTQDLEKDDDPYIIEHTDMKKILENKENFNDDEFITTTTHLLLQENENELITTTEKLDQNSYFSKNNDNVNSASPINDVYDRNKKLPYDIDFENSTDIEDNVFTTESYNSLFVSTKIKHLLVENNSTKSQNLKERLINSKRNLKLLPQVQNTTNSSTEATNCSTYFNICFQGDQKTVIKKITNTTSNTEGKNVTTEKYKHLVASYENVDLKSNEQNGFHSYVGIPKEYHKNIPRNNSQNSFKKTLINVDQKTTLFKKNLCETDNKSKNDTTIKDKIEKYNFNVTANFCANTTLHTNITESYESTTEFINKEASEVSSISVETQQNTLLPFDYTEVDVTKDYDNKTKFISKQTSQISKISEESQQVILLPFNETAADVTEDYGSKTKFLIEEISQLTNISDETQKFTFLPFDNIAATLFEHFSPRDVGQTLNDNLADEVAGIGKALPVSITSPSNRSSLIIIFSSGIALLFIVVSVTIFLISFQRQHGTLDIEMQERNCGKDDLDMEDAQTLTKLLDVKLSPIVHILDESEECL